MSKIQENKRLIWKYWQAMDRGLETDVFHKTVHKDVVWHGFHPLRHLSGADAVWADFWQPLLHAIPDLVRRPYHFISGEFEGYDWVCGTGDFVGTFVNEWLGIPAPPRGLSIHFRFGEFCKIVDNQIVEIRIIVDLLDVMRQAGFNVVPPNSGRDIWTPGSVMGDGVTFEPQDPAESKKSLELVEEMIFGGLNKYDGDQDSQGLEKYWHPDMVWHGPVMLGSMFGMDEFKQNAQGPILGAFPDRRGIGHQSRFAEGLFIASTGWPSLAATHEHPFFDWEPTGERIGWNIMDFWRRDGDLLAENWVMIDLIDGALASGVDLMARLEEQKASRASE